MSIEVRNVSKSFDGTAMLRDVSLAIPTGELVALLGPSGAGKTTLLRVIGGLDEPDAGSVRFFGKDAADSGARERGVGFVFQHFALFRHMTVFENVAFGLRVQPKAQRPAEAEIEKTVRDLLGLVKLEAFAERLPEQLSGGQRQRVALARALAVRPKVLLLDEPFGSLDANVRQELRRWLRSFHDDLGVTSVFVTHDQEEALEVADRIVVMNDGRVEQIGTPEEVYHRPVNAFVFRFLGRTNSFSGRIQRGRVRLGELELEAPGLSEAEGRPAVVYVRPHDIDISGRPEEGFLAAGVVRRVNAAGPVLRLELEPRWGEGAIVVECPAETLLQGGLAVGAPAYFRIRKHRVFVEEAR